MNEPQEGAQTPEARIAEVMREHQPSKKADNTSRPGYRIWRDGCSGCDWIGDYTGTDYESFTVHVATAVVLALGLTPETRRNLDSRTGRERRLVTKWEQQT